MKRLTETLLGLICALLIPVSAYGYNVELAGLKYLLNDDGTASVTGATNKNITELTIPAEITVYEHVDGGDRWFSETNYSNGTERKFRVTVVGTEAFSSYSNLTSVTFPATLKTISLKAFWGCSSITEITLPEGLTSLGDEAFYSCSKLTHVVFPDGLEYIRYGTFAFCPITQLNLPKNLKGISDNAFEGCQITELTLPENMEGLGGFKFCQALKTVTLNNSIQRIYDGCFYDCKQLESINMPESLEYISPEAFFGCEKLKQFVIPENTKTIGNFAFLGCNIDELRRAFSDSKNPGIKTDENGFIFFLNNIDPNVLTYGISCINPICPSAEVVDTYVVPDYLTVQIAPLARKITVPETYKKANTSYWDYYTSDVLEELEIYSTNFPNVYFTKVENNTAKAKYPNLKKVRFPYEANLMTQFMSKIYSSAKGAYMVDFFVPEKVETPTISKNSYCFPKQSYDAYYNGNRLYVDIYPALQSTLSVYNQSDFSKVELRYCRFNEVEILSPVKTIVLASLQQSNLTVLNLGRECNMTSQMLYGCAKLRKLILPETGLGANGHLGALFGNGGDGMRAVNQLTESATSTYTVSPLLEELELSEGCINIPYGALSNLVTLKKITLPSTLAIIAEKGLYGCAGVTDIYCHSAEPPAAFDNSFDGMRTSSCIVHVPAGCAEIYRRSPGWQKFYYIQEEAPIAIEVEKNIQNAGVVYGMNQYAYGAPVELSAAANTGYTFRGWYEDDYCISSASKLSFTATGSRAIVAVFACVLDNADNAVETAVSGTDVKVKWAPIAGADSYEVSVYLDQNLLWPEKTMTIDATGRLLTRGASDLSVTLGGLNELATYYYTVSAINAQGKCVDQFGGSFKTDVANVGVVAPVIDTPAVTVIYTIAGRPVNGPLEALPAGIYIVNGKKVVKRAQ